MSGDQPEQPTSAPGQASRASRSVPDLEAGRRIGRFELERELGAGGMGVVFLARDSRLGRRVAIKALAAGRLSDPRLRARFEREARLAAALSHANVATLYGVEEHEGETYLVFEYVEGQSLAQVLARGELSVARAIEVAAQIAAGVAAAHKAGVVHRDLKPANVMLDSEGSAKVLDFGIGKQLDDDPPALEVTESGMILGTFGYMSPEQVRGQRVDARADVWALGCILFECLTGRRPFPARTYADGIAAIVSGEPDWSLLPRNCPRRVEQLLRRSLSKEPDQRPVDASQFGAALPGGYALKAALAAGETPTPEMVAAADEEGGLSVRTSLAWVAVALAAVVLVCILKPRFLVASRLALDKSPPVLVERARSLLDALDPGRVVHDTRSMWVNDQDVWRWIAESSDPAERERALLTARPAALLYWYRESPSSMAPLGLDPADDRGDITPQNPPLVLPGMTRVVLDPRGRLIELVRLARDEEWRAAERVPEFDWTLLFGAAGLEFGNFTRVEPHAPPAVVCDQRLAWDGPVGEHALSSLHIEAGTVRGRPVYFTTFVRWPWLALGSAPVRAASEDPAKDLHLVMQILVAALLSIASWLHWKRGVADGRGALRMFLFAFVAGMVAWAFEADHVLDPPSELHLLLTESGYALLGALVLWTVYIAIEPYIRRRWPWRMVSWNRLLAGRFHDAMVGRDLLLGAAGGAVAQALSFAQFALVSGPTLTQDSRHAVAISLLNGEARFVVSRALYITLEMQLKVFAFMGAFCFLHRWLGREWPARLVAMALLFVVQGQVLASTTQPADFVRLALVFTIWLALAERLGILAVFSGTLVFTLLYEWPPLRSLEDWWLRESVLLLLIVLLLVAWGAWCASRSHWRRAGTVLGLEDARPSS